MTDASELVILRAADDAALVAEMSRLLEFIDRVPDVRLLDVAYTCALAEGPATLAIVAQSVDDLRERLFSARSRIGTGTAKRLRDKSGTYFSSLHLAGEGRGKVAFVYSGVMGFYPDMMRDLAVAFPECRSAFDELEEAVAGEPGGFLPGNFIFPPADCYRHDADVFSSGAYSQALVSTYAGCTALTRLLELVGVRPDGVVGFAGGDLAAMMRSGAAGAAPARPERVRAIREIYRVVANAIDHSGLPRTAMISVVLRHEGEADELIASFPKGKVTVAVDFSPRQKTLAVEPDFEEELMARFSEAGIFTVRLPLDRPFNTRKCDKVVSRIKKFTSSWMRHDPTCDVYSCATADRLPRSVRKARNDAAERWAEPVRFRETILRMYEDGYRVFVEVGPRGLMTSAVEDTLKGREHVAVALNSIHRTALLQFRQSLGLLASIGVKTELGEALARRGARRLDFDSAISLEVRKEAEMRLSRAFPKLSLLGEEPALAPTAMPVDPKGRGAKAALRAAVVEERRRQQRRFDWGVMNPLVSDADRLSESPGVAVEIVKTFDLRELPFIGDFALGNSQLSYSDPDLRGLVLLTLPVGVEIMAETAKLVMPRRTVTAVGDVSYRRMISFREGRLKLFIHAERCGSSDPSVAAVKVVVRDTPNLEHTDPLMSAIVELSETGLPPKAAEPEPLANPRSVHWLGLDIYPTRICCGRRLRNIRSADTWSESGLDYEIKVPRIGDCVSFTSFPLWVVNPLLLETVASGFPLWRSHERFAGAFAFPFRLRRLVMRGLFPNEGAQLNCYLRLTGVTPRSHLCDITVTDGNGTAVMEISGWEELTDRAPSEYRDLVLQPAKSFLTRPIAEDILGEPATNVAGAFITDVPYEVFERNEELWLKTLSHVVLNAAERREFLSMPGSTSRRTEWLFGRIAAKDAVRRYMKDFHQERWSDADVRIWHNDSGKPVALGQWSEHLTSNLDVAIAHTARFVIAIAASNARVGVDVEAVGRNLSEEFTNGVFAPSELELAARSPKAQQAVIRFWCAKEAVSKALGTGIRYSPRELIVSDYLPDAGRILVRLEGAWAEAFKRLKGRDIEVVSRVMRDHALAFCYIPAVLFADDL